MCDNIKLNYSDYTIIDEIKGLNHEEDYDSSVFPLNFTKLTENELEIEDLVSDSVLTASKPSLDSEGDIEFILKEALDSTKVLDKNYIGKLSKVNIKLHEKFDYYCFFTRFLNDFCIEDGIPKSDIGEIHIPKKNLRFSSIAIGHEYIHSLKDINYYEVLDLHQFVEVIPQFYELLAVNSELSHLKEDWQKVKTYLFSSLRTTFEPEALRDKLGLYYSLLMYNLHKKYPKEVLKEVNEVLQNKKTTSEILKDMDIYKISDDKTKIFKKELKMLYN